MLAPMEFQDVVRRRRMVRNFDSRPLAPELVERVLANALQGPSAGFTQGTELLVLEGPEETGRYWDACFPVHRRAGFRWPGVLQAPLLVVPLASPQAYLDRYAEPDKGWIDRDRSRWPVAYWDVDAAFATLLALLTAVDEGLGALFFRVFQPDALRAEFAIPERLSPVGTIAIGHPLADEPSPSRARGRRPQSDVVHRGGFEDRRPG
jgi:nitroreductase